MFNRLTRIVEVGDCLYTKDTVVQCLSVYESSILVQKLELLQIQEGFVKYYPDGSNTPILNKVLISDNLIGTPFSLKVKRMGPFSIIHYYHNKIPYAPALPSMKTLSWLPQGYQLKAAMK